MTFQAYMDTIKAKTGKTPADFKLLAAEKRLVEYREILTWLKSDFGLGHGHANAMAHVILGTFDSKLTMDEQIAKHFASSKSGWRKPFDALWEKIQDFGPDVQLSPSGSYISILRDKTKFAIVQVTVKRLDIGIRRKGVPATDRFEESGKWNAMVTHRAKIANPDQIDAELISRLQQAYDNA